MILMVIPRPNLIEPAPIPPRAPAKLPLDAGVDKNTVDGRKSGRLLEHFSMPLLPECVVDSVGGAIEEAKRLDIGACAVGVQVKGRTHVIPDIDINTALMASVTEWHGASAGHAEISLMQYAKTVRCALS